MHMTGTVLVSRDISDSRYFFLMKLEPYLIWAARYRSKIVYNEAIECYTRGKLTSTIIGTNNKHSRGL